MPATEAGKFPFLGRQRASGITGASVGADEGGALNSALGDTAGQPAYSLTSPLLNSPFVGGLGGLLVSHGSAAAATESDS